MKHVEIALKIVGLLLCLIFSFFQKDFVWIQMGLFCLILFSVGIPHGAIDHLISNPILKKKTFLIFLAKYLSLLTAYLVIWYYFPVFALIAFLVMSAYHFGQTHYIDNNQIIKRLGILYFSRGGYFLAVILVGSWESTNLILSELISLDTINQYRFGIVIFFLVGTVAIQTILGPIWSKTHVLELIFLGPLLYFSPLMVSFIVYFGFWHAVPSMLKEYDFLQKFQRYNSPKKFVLHLLPFSLISLIGIGVILIFGVKYLDENKLILLFFILISLISFPHILYMDQFLRKEIKTD